MTVKELFKEVTSGLDKRLTQDIKWLFREKFLRDTYLWTKTQIDVQSENDLRKGAKRLISGEPLAYVIGYVPFYMCNINVDKRVLIPRPETELLCDMICEDYYGHFVKILDLCTGSGCIAIALASKLSNVLISASDISQDALDLAQQNAKENDVDIEFIKSDLLNDIDDTFDVIVSNPPYLSHYDMTEVVDKSVKDYEPHLALFGGEDGLDFYRKIAEQAPAKLNPRGTLYLEVGDHQANQVLEILRPNFEEFEIITDYGNFDRIIKARRK